MDFRHLHGHPTRAAGGWIADGVAVIAATVAVALDPGLGAGALAIVAVVVFQRITARGPVPRPVVLGMRQMAMGLGVVVVTALGYLASTA